METYQLGNYTFDIVNDPAKTLSPDEKAKIISESIPVARKAFRNDGVTESDIILHAVEVPTGIYLKNADGRLIGFSSCLTELVGDKIIIHLEGAALAPEYQGEGLYPILVVLRILYEAEKHDPAMLLIGTRTQSPIVYYSICEKLGLYPQIDAPIPADLQPVGSAYATLISEKHSDFKPKNGVDFDPSTFIIRRAYGGVDKDNNEFGFCMYGNSIPWLKDNERINQFFKNNLDFNDGDAFLLLGPYSHSKNFDVLSSAIYRINPQKLPLLERFKK
jgi:hypothetical protein